MGQLLDSAIMNELLELYDYNVRFTNPKTADDYDFGYADGIGQCILVIAKSLGDGYPPPYKYEAYKRVMEYETTTKYWKKYPTPLASYFPAEIIRYNGGKL